MTSKRRIRRTIIGSYAFTAEKPIDEFIEPIWTQDWILEEDRRQINTSEYSFDDSSRFAFEDSQDSLGRIGLQNVISDKALQNVQEKFIKFDDYSMIIEEEGSVPNPSKVSTTMHDPSPRNSDAIVPMASPSAKDVSLKESFDTVKPLDFSTTTRDSPPGSSAARESSFFFRLGESVPMATPALSLKNSTARKSSFFQQDKSTSVPTQASSLRNDRSAQTKSHYGNITVRKSSFFQQNESVPVSAHASSLRNSSAQESSFFQHDKSVPMPTQASSLRNSTARKSSFLQQDQSVPMASNDSDLRITTQKELSFFQQDQSALVPAQASSLRNSAARKSSFFQQDQSFPMASHASDLRITTPKESSFFQQDESVLMPTQASSLRNITARESSFFQQDQNVPMASNSSNLRITTPRESSFFQQDENVPMASQASFLSATKDVSLKESFYTVKQLDTSQTIFYLKDYVGDDCRLSQLLHVCNMNNVSSWNNVMLRLSSEDVCKLGEGAFGEVFKTKLDGRQEIALKVFPFKHDPKVKKYPLVNDAEMSEPGAIITEIVLTGELSKLASSNENMTLNFVQLLEKWVVKGNYPQSLKKAWKDFSDKKETLNTNPTKYSSLTRHYIAMALSLGGIELELFEVKTEEKMLSIFLQILLSLAISESEMEFEHRDLHWSNILITDDESKQTLEYIWNGERISIKTFGVIATIIDFTNSRIQRDTDIVYMDLSMDEDLFTQDGDIQFQVYRDMRTYLNNDWSQYCPKTNCLWLEYLVKKLTDQEKRKEKHFVSKKKMEKIFNVLQDVQHFNSAGEFMKSAIIKNFYSSFFL